MAYIDHIHACNQHELTAFRPFVVDARHVGWVNPLLAGRLADFPACFAVTEERVYLVDGLRDMATRSAAVAEVADRLVDSGDLPPSRGELYPVMTGWGEPPLLTLDRAFVPAFGVPAFGLHVNGYVETPEGLEMWIGRRAEDRAVEPGKLDNLVGGGHAHGAALADTLVKEAQEEAGLPSALALQARPVGAVRYLMQVPVPGAGDGLKRDVLFLYDLRLPVDVIPQCQDGEVEAFYRWPVGEVAQRVRDTSEFKFNVPLVIIDFLIRHAIITPDEPDYVELIAGLCR